MSEKKIMDKYNPKEFEEKLYNEWEKKAISSHQWTKQKKVIV